MVSSGLVAFSISLAAASRTDFASRQQGWFLDGVRLARFRDPLESGHLVLRPPGIQFSHPHRIRYWRGDCQPVDGRTDRNSPVSIGDKPRTSASLCCSLRWSVSAVAALLLLAARALIHDEKLYKAPEGNEPPPFYIRCLLVLTCTGVSFFHGSNDGQKGMGLIMLILIGTVPTAYALNHAVTYQRVPGLHRRFAAGRARARPLCDARCSHWRRARRFDGIHPQQAIHAKHHARDADAGQRCGHRNQHLQGAEKRAQRSGSQLPQRSLSAQRSFADHGKTGQPKFAAADAAILANYKKHVDHSTRFIPTWVKVAVAMALGLGTMVGWKRIVVTVGEKIGKEHLTYAQGAAAEITAMATIGARMVLASRSARPMCCPREWPAPWPRIVRGSSWPPFATWRWHGCSPFPWPCSCRDRCSGFSERSSSAGGITTTAGRNNDGPQHSTLRPDHLLPDSGLL